jgi:hypothetical protein
LVVKQKQKPIGDINGNNEVIIDYKGTSAKESRRTRFLRCNNTEDKDSTKDWPSKDWRNNNELYKATFRN